MRHIILTFGLIAGAVLSVLMALSMAFHDRMSLGQGMVVGYTSMVLAFLMVYFGVRAYRDNVAGGHIGFGRAFLVGLGITLIASACYVATWQVIYYRFMPDFMDKYAAAAVEKAQKSGASPAQVEAKRKEMAEFNEMYKNPLVNIAFTLLEPLPVGLVFTLVSAGLLSRRRKAGGVAPA